MHSNALPKRHLVLPLHTAASHRGPPLHAPHALFHWEGSFGARAGVLTAQILAAPHKLTQTAPAGRAAVNTPAQLPIDALEHGTCPPPRPGVCALLLLFPLIQIIE